MISSDNHLNLVIIDAYQCGLPEHDDFLDVFHADIG